MRGLLHDGFHDAFSSVGAVYDRAFFRIDKDARS
jgi:hypothetical protein